MQISDQSVVIHQAECTGTQTEGHTSHLGRSNDIMRVSYHSSQVLALHPRIVRLLGNSKATSPRCFPLIEF